jgi:hypothetical protein
MRIAVAVLIAIALAAGPVAAGTLADARVGFSADRTLVVNGQTFHGRMVNMPGKERHEQNLNGIPSVFILRTDSPIGEAVLPKLHTVVQFVLPPELRLLAVSHLAKHAVGHDTVNGIATTRYAVEEKVPEGHGTGTVWLSSQGIPMKIAGTFTNTKGRVATLRWELSNVKIGPQPSALFDAPAGFTKLPAEAVAPLLGLHLHAKR